MRITTQASGTDFTPIDVVIRVETQAELDAIKELSVLNVGDGVTDDFTDESRVDEFLDKLFEALEDC